MREWVSRSTIRDRVRFVPLVAKETRPWAEWKSGKPLTTNQLAALLRPHKIRPDTIKLSAPPAYDREVDQHSGNNGKPTASGYMRKDFTEALEKNEPHRVCRRPIGLSHAASFCSSSMA